MDFALIIGILVGFGALLAGFSLESGALHSLMLLSPLIIVLGGTMGAVFASFPIKDFIKAVTAVGSTFKTRQAKSTESIITKIAEVAEKYRHEGMKSLDGFLAGSELDSEEFLLLKEGIVLIQSAKQPDEIQYILESDIRSYTQRKEIEISVWESAAGYSPTMGVIGTVMGLITVLAAGFDDPAVLASSISTAFVATLYGVSFANLIYLPIATKLKSILRRTKIQKEMVVDGVGMIAKGDPSRNVENALSLYYQVFADGNKLYKQGIDK